MSHLCPLLLLLLKQLDTFITANSVFFHLLRHVIDNHKQTAFSDNLHPIIARILVVCLNSAKTNLQPTLRKVKFRHLMWKAIRNVPEMHRYMGKFF